MNFNQYQEEAERTATHPNGVAERQMQSAVFGLGLCGEAGEVVEMLKKNLGHGHMLDLGKLEKELGDVLWYLSAIASDHGLSLEVIAQANIDKLRKRYPNGFSHSDSINRKE